MDNQLLTVNEAADYFSINPWQIREYVRQGLLPRQYISKNNIKYLVFPKQTLIDFLIGGNVKHG